ncbi:MFS transporter [Streptomyces sp. NPDC059564]|uniref:MFS transporter n=1 Tax=Streptomyces sp. NPDC059564 TaxID=3346865 RepID=UPI00368370EF
MQTTQTTSLRAGRQATFAFFLLNGFLMGMWIVHIPVIERRTGIGHAQLGWLLLLLGAGAFLGMRLAGPLTDRLGARRVLPVSAALCGAAVLLPGLAGDAPALGAALLLLGLGNGTLDVSMNAHAVQVERGYGRPLMSAFHAAFSVGGVLAALAGALALGRGWSPATTLGITAAGSLVVTALAARLLLPHTPTGPDPTATAPSTASPRRIRILAGLAFLLMLCEGVANDWSTPHLKDVLGASAGTAALAYGAFATAMTVGRLFADRVSGRFGPAAVLRVGSAVGAGGLALAALAPNAPVALAGWAVLGAGLSGCVPQLFSAAGHADPDAAGANVSRVAGLGYLGMLAGPAVIGPLTHLVPLDLALLLPVALCLVVTAASGILTGAAAQDAAPVSRRTG